MFHLLVSTVTGAEYLFRLATNGSGNVYVTSRGSSSGLMLTNALLDASSVIVSVGQRMRLRNEWGPVVLTSAVRSWELSRVDKVWQAVTSANSNVKSIVDVDKHDVFVTH